MAATLLQSEYASKSVLVTGHSGFKGSWLTAWLSHLGANVVGVSLPPDQGPDNVYEKAGIEGICKSIWQDIRDAAGVRKIIQEAQPEIIFHLAAQPLVRRSYQKPLMTFETNIIGAANVLEAARQCPSVKAVVFVTSDKVYQNNEWEWAYRETDRLGGLDPYSASKSAAELVAKSYMSVLKGDGFSYRLATARGGNVIGGGDWSEDRIVPDIVRSLRAGEALSLRSPTATRPWQHVLELCAGYLVLGTRLLSGWDERSHPVDFFTGSWNFGPERTNEMSVGRLVETALKHWGTPNHPVELGKATVHEATYLRVDSSKSQAYLGWQPYLDFDDTIAWTLDWYREYVSGSVSARDLIDTQIGKYEKFYERLGR